MSEIISTRNYTYENSNKNISYPWARYWARSLDISIYGFSFMIISARTIPQISNANSQILSLLSIIAAFIIDAIIMAATGSSIGKAIVGIRVTDANGNNPRLTTTARRNISIYTNGLGLFIPIVGFFTLMNCYGELRKTGTTTWDSKLNTKVISKGVTIYRVIIAAILYIAILALFIWLAQSANREGTSVSKKISYTLPEQVQVASTQINQGLPKKIDDVTTLESTTPTGTTLEYNYAVNLNKYQFDASKPILESKLRKESCKAGGLSKIGVTAIYFYKNASGLLGKIDIRPQDCQYSSMVGTSPNTARSSSSPQ